VTFSDLEVAVSQSSRKHGYIRDNIFSVWTPGAGRAQHGYSRELAGAMLYEADEFFDRAFALSFLRGHLRELQASTWAAVAVYYANYFLALSFVRLHMKSVTQLAGGQVFEVIRTDNQTPYFTIKERRARQRHADVWRSYYDVATQMAWPDRATATDIAPTLDTLRFREQLDRERVNYRPGEGFDEIHLTRARYLKTLKVVLMDDGGAPLTISDAAYTDRMAAQRLKHLATLLHRLSGSRLDIHVEASLWNRRGDMVTKYARDQVDKRFGALLIRGLTGSGDRSVSIANREAGPAPVTTIRADKRISVRGKRYLCCLVAPNGTVGSAGFLGSVPCLGIRKWAPSGPL
jgi:hypothetical protein